MLRFTACCRLRASVRSRTSSRPRWQDVGQAREVEDVGPPRRRLECVLWTPERTGAAEIARISRVSAHPFDSAPENARGANETVRDSEATPRNVRYTHLLGRVVRVACVACVVRVARDETVV